MAFRRIETDEDDDDNEGHEIVITEAELELMLTRTAEAAARKTLAAIGLDDSAAGTDLRELRDWLKAKRMFSTEFMKAVASILAKAVVLAILAGVAMLIMKAPGG